MTEYTFQCRYCERNSRVEWDGSRDQVEFVCPYCSRVEISVFRIVEDNPSVDIFWREIPVNVQPYERFNPLGIGETGMDLSPTKRQRGKTRMKRLENLDFREPEEPDSLVRRAKKILDRIFGFKEERGE